MTHDILAFQTLVLSSFSSGPPAINVHVLTTPATLAVDAVEIFDRRSLRLSADSNEMVSLSPEIVGLPEEEEAAALLIECRGATPEDLAAQIKSVTDTLVGTKVPVLTKTGYTAESFKHDPVDYNTYWDMRKG